MRRTAMLVLAAAFSLSLAVPPAWAFLGFGKKKSQNGDAGKEQKELPGMDAGGAQPPGAAEETAKPAGEAAAGKAPESSGSPEAEGPAGGRPAGEAEKAAGQAKEGQGGLPTEVVIKGADSGSKLNTAKPPLRIDIDPYESIRASLQPDESLLLAESPLTISWRRTHPEFLANPRVVEPWRTTFSERAGIAFYPREQLFEAIGRKLDPKETKGYQWSLSIADEEGRVFQHYEASSNPPEELLWSGQNDQGEWIKAGRSYSPIFMFTDPGGSPHTKVGKTLQFTGIVHQENDGLHVSVDSAVLFGSNKAARALEKGGAGLLRSASDLVKRRYAGIPIRVQAYAATKELAEAQAKLVQEDLMSELMLMPQNVAAESSHAVFSDQRVEIVLLNR